MKDAAIFTLGNGLAFFGAISASATNSPDAFFLWITSVSSAFITIIVGVSRILKVRREHKVAERISKMLEETALLNRKVAQDRHSAAHYKAILSAQSLCARCVLRALEFKSCGIADAYCWRKNPNLIGKSGSK